LKDELLHFTSQQVPQDDPYAHQTSLTAVTAHPFVW